MKYRKPKMTKYDQELLRDQIWEEKFIIMLKYRELYGTIIVPNRSSYPDIPEWENKLARWVLIQRQQNRKGKLLGWRYDKLVSVGFEFEPLETRFEQHFADFLKFKEKYGHVLVPRNYTEIPVLATWVGHLRSKPVREDRRKRLDAEGFVWDAIDERFETKFNELAEYKRIHGNFKISEKREGYAKLTSWMNKARMARKTGKGQRITDEKIRLLDSIGFPWDPQDSSFQNSFNKLQEFIKKYNHPHVIIKNCEIEGLGTWVYWIRKTKNNLTQEQMAQLDGVGFEWDAMVALEKRIELENKQTGKTKPLPPIRWRKEKDETKE